MAKDSHGSACEPLSGDMASYSEPELVVKGVRLDILPIGRAPVLRVRRDMGLVIDSPQHRSGTAMLTDRTFENLIARQLEVLAEKGCRVEEIQVGFDVIETIDSLIGNTLETKLRSNAKPARLVLPAATRATEAAIAHSGVIRQMCMRSRSLGYRCHADTPVSLEVLALTPDSMDAPSRELASDAANHLQSGQWFAVMFDLNE